MKIKYSPYDSETNEDALRNFFSLLICLKCAKNVESITMPKIFTRKNTYIDVIAEM